MMSGLGVGVNQRRPAGKLREFAHERAGAVRDNKSVSTQLHTLRDVDLAGNNDRHTLRHLADVRQRLACGIGAAGAETAHALDLGGLKREKHLSGARLDDRFFRVGHWIPMS